MPAGNTTRYFGSVAKTFHWLTALLVLTVLPVGIIANGMAHDLRAPGVTPTDAEIARVFTLFSLHKTLGVFIFFVALARIIWALTQPRPRLLNADNRLEATLAETVHWLLYGSLVLVPLTGWIHHAATPGFAPIVWPFGQTLPFVPVTTSFSDLTAGLHIVFERVLAASIFLHVAGALKHHVIDRDSTLRRMLPGSPDLPELPDTHHSLMPPLLALVIWGAALAVGSGLGVYGQPRIATDAGSAPAASPQEKSDGAADWTVVDGTLGLTITQSGNAVTGQFADWTAAITFTEPETTGPAGDVTVEIAIPSLELGSVADQAQGPDFFDSSSHPTAMFKADITRTSDGYEAAGPLTIKGNSIPITLPFDLEIDGDAATMSGALTLDRRDFAIGGGVTDEQTLGFEVEIDVTLTAARSATGN